MQYALLIISPPESGSAFPQMLDFLKLIRVTEKRSLLFSSVLIVFFHCAALPRVEDSIRNPEESHDVNVTGTLNVLVAATSARSEACHFLRASSAIYGNHAESPLREELAPIPLSPYALHKYISEKYLILFAQLYGLETVSLRFFNVYGPGLNPEGAYAADRSLL